jgi:hypothetical protein
MENSPGRLWSEIQGTPEQKLAYLQWHWSRWYDISKADGRWRAVRLDDDTECEEESAEELRDAMLADYTARPVPRFRKN